MKKLAVLVIAVLLVPSLAHAQYEDCSQIGSDLRWYGEPYVLPEGNIPILPGEELTFDELSPGQCLAICFESPTDADYFGSLALDSEEGWTYGLDFGYCWYIDLAGCYYWTLSVTCPEEAEIGTINTVHLVTTYCDPVSCELDPALATDTLTVYFEVVERHHPPMFQKGKKMQ